MKNLNLNENSIKFLSILPRINTQKDVPSCFKDIFNSRELFINNFDLTGDYIKFIRSINKSEEKQYQMKISGNRIKIINDYFKKIVDQYDYMEYVKLCEEEKLIDSNKIIYKNNPLI